MRDRQKLLALHKAVCKSYDLHRSQLFDKSREENKTEARLLFSWISFRYLKVSQYKIAEYCGKSKVAVHKNVISVDGWMDTDPKYPSRVREIMILYHGPNSLIKRVFQAISRIFSILPKMKKYEIADV